MANNWINRLFSNNDSKFDTKKMNISHSGVINLKMHAAQPVADPYVLRPRNHGAVGDGQHDDTVAFQEMLALINPNEDGQYTIEFDPGRKYRITQPLEIAESIGKIHRIRIDGRMSELFADGNFTLLKKGDVNADFDDQGVDTFVISGIHFRTLANEAIGLELANLSGIHIHDCQFQRFYKAMHTKLCLTSRIDGVQFLQSKYRNLILDEASNFTSLSSIRVHTGNEDQYAGIEIFRSSMPWVTSFALEGNKMPTKGGIFVDQDTAGTSKGFMGSHLYCEMAGLDYANNPFLKFNNFNGGVISMDGIFNQSPNIKLVDLSEVKNPKKVSINSVQYMAPGVKIVPNVQSGYPDRGYTFNDNVFDATDAQYWDGAVPVKINQNYIP